jgi:hypothetical protein
MFILLALLVALPVGDASPQLAVSTLLQGKSAGAWKEQKSREEKKSLYSGSTSKYFGFCFETYQKQRA